MNRQPGLFPIQALTSVTAANWKNSMWSGEAKSFCVVVTPAS